MDLKRNKMRCFKIPWNRKGQKGVEKEEKFVNTSWRREKRGKAQEALTVCELSIYRENSCEKLLEQVIHISDLVQKNLNCVPKYIMLSTKIYYSVHKYVIQYINILLNVKIYFRSSTKIH